jgi:hypothetical protein
MPWNKVLGNKSAQNQRTLLHASTSSGSSLCSVTQWVQVAYGCAEEPHFKLCAMRT